jgi:hypothetical protein
MEAPMEMWTRLLAGFAASVMLLSGTALAQGRPAGCERAPTPEMVDGQVVKIDPEQGTLTLRGPTGESYEFRASKETLQGYEVGDRIQAKLRTDPNCERSAS